MSKIKNYVFIFGLAVLFSSQVQAGSDGGDEEDTTPDIASSPCSDNPGVVTCQAWGLEWQLIVVEDGGELGIDTVDVHKTFDSFTAALDCANGDGTDVECDFDNDDEGWRLPNIRELSKLFRYTPVKDDNGHYIEEIGNTALTYATMRNWFKGKYFKPESTTLALSDANGDITTGIEPYLLSSTYRDLDDDNTDVQVLAMNLMKGTIVSMTREGRFCPIARKDGECGGVTDVRDKDVNPIFVIKVKTYVPSVQGMTLKRHTHYLV